MRAPGQLSKLWHRIAKTEHNRNHKKTVCVLIYMFCSFPWALNKFLIAPSREGTGWRIGILTSSGRKAAAMLRAPGKIQKHKTHEKINLSEHFTEKYGNHRHPAKASHNFVVLNPSHISFDIFPEFRSFRGAGACAKRLRLLWQIRGPRPSSGADPVATSTVQAAGTLTNHGKTHCQYQ